MAASRDSVFMDAPGIREGCVTMARRLGTVGYT